jgi:hypothetical protein
MPVYEAAKVHVKKQIDQTACWASLVSAVAGSLGFDCATPEVLRQHYQPTGGAVTAGQVPPEKALRERFRITTETHKYDQAATDDAKRKQMAEIEAVLVETLENTMPVIGGLTTSDGLGLQLKDGSGSAEWKHAVLFVKYDSDQKKTWYMDPAKGDDYVREATLRGLVYGFDYMQASDFGPKACEKIIPRAIVARVFRLIAPTGTG